MMDSLGTIMHALSLEKGETQRPKTEPLHRTPELFYGAAREE